MDGHGRSTTTSVAELRLRLYRPGPPAGAAASYLHALRASPLLRSSGAVGTPQAPSRRDGGALATLGTAACALAGVAAAVLLGHQVPAILAPSTIVHGQASTGTPSGRLPAPPLTGQPLGDLFGTGPASGDFTANGHRVVASVLCTGSGTIAIRLGAAPPTVLTCETGTPALAMVASAARLDRFTITVTPDGPIRWSLAAGALTS